MTLVIEWCFHAWDFEAITFVFQENSLLVLPPGDMDAAIKSQKGRSRLREIYFRQRCSWSFGAELMGKTLREVDFGLSYRSLIPKACCKKLWQPQLRTACMAYDCPCVSGLVTAYIAQLVMGRTGTFLILTMFTMLVMSTGSGEIMAVSSIIVYDIYQTYIRPFR